MEAIESPEFMDEVVPVKSGGTLFVRAARGNVDVRTHDGEEVRVEAEARGRRPERVIFVLEVAGDDVRFQVRTEGWLAGIFGGLEVRVRIWVPKRYSVALRSSGGHARVDGVTGDVDLHASGGDVTLSGVEGRVDLVTSGGSVEMENLDGDVRVRSSGGNTEMRDVYGDVSLHSSGGDLVIDGVDGSVRARSSGGSTSVVFLGDPEGDISSSGGSIEVLVREEACFALDAKSHGGKIEVDMELDRERDGGSQRVSGHRGPRKGPRLKLRSSGGGIRVGLL
jgi:putative adhesin